MKKAMLLGLMCTLAMGSYAVPLENAGSAVPSLNVLTGFDTTEAFQQVVKNKPGVNQTAMGQVFTLGTGAFELSALYLKSYTSEDLSNYSGTLELKIFSGTGGAPLQTFAYEFGTGSVAKGDWIKLDLGGYALPSGGQYSFLVYTPTADADHDWGFWKSKNNEYGTTGDHGLYVSANDYTSVWNSSNPWINVAHRADSDDHAFFLTGSDGSGGGVDSPDTPAGVAALAGNGLVSLSWDANTQAGFGHFVVKRSTISGGSYTALPGAVPVTDHFIDTNVVNGTTYYYVVSAVNTEDVESPNSVEVSATPNGSIARPNIFVIYIDDQDPSYGCYDGAFGISHDAALTHTPNIDTLAAAGVRYDRAYVVNPVCSPSHTSLFTGNHVTTLGCPHHKSHYIDELPEGHGSLPELLRDAGYYTVNLSNGDIRWGASGKIDTNYERPPIMNPVEGDDPWQFDAIHGFDFTGPATAPSCDPTTIFMGGNWTNRLAGQPFFAWANIETGKAHGFGTGTTWAQANGVAVDPDDIMLPPYLVDAPIADWKDYVAKSLNSISCTDYVVGQFLQGLELAGEAENTLVILASDHGRATMRHKQWLYETGIHVPMIIRWPGEVAPGSVETNLTSIIDIAATCVGAAGAIRPPKMEGLDLMGDDLASRVHVFASRDGVDGTFDRSRTVVGHRYKYIRNFYPELPYINGSYATSKLDGRGMQDDLNLLTTEQRRFLEDHKDAEEFYDLQADPFEVNNLAADPAHADKVAEYRQLLAEWMESTGDYAPDAHVTLGGIAAVTSVQTLLNEYAILNADADGDGLSYYHELALDLDPNVMDASMATSYVINAFQEMDYTVRNLRDGVSYQVQVSTNLVDWQVYTNLPGDSAGSPTTLTLPASIAAGGKLFVRMVIPQ
ncbi:Arylsulfatase [Pontiella desulfatans]|uniref:Arylsulfatase n=1 Tax=Pontiella desulfatans TaxID=2750659 RepID=A0A6C2U5R1_PONDE|nr:sulfatase-like hydrolase/transferase [Pontiella desulfatans]SPS73974.1 sulfatase S1_8 [Kiritimatiellales bacterium]VGO15418.1 Arylsulfatase [Pontiella desulfatans]